jgi:hypothetical protein
MANYKVPELIKSYPTSNKRITDTGWKQEVNIAPPAPGVVGTMQGHNEQITMPALPPVEIQKRLKKLETTVITTPTVALVDDQYVLDKETIYVAYASALSNLVNTKIPNQSDATDFQYGPFNPNGVLLAFRGFFKSKSIYQSGDPTDYTWESTSGLTGFGVSERATTTSTGFLATLGNPTKPGAGVTWTTVNPGSSIAANAVWLAERFTVGTVTSGWTIEAVGSYISAGQLVDGAVIAAKVAANAITTAKILNDAIDNAKIASNAVNNDSIAANAVTANEIQAGSIGVQELAANSVTANAIAANSIVASKITAGTITATQIAADAITANKIATNAITADAIAAGTITATEIASNAITSAKVSADAITVDKIDLNGTLSVTANSGAIRWGKSDGDDLTNSGLFVGRNSGGSPRFTVGSAASFIYFNGTTGVLSIIGASVSATTGVEENFFTATGQTHVFQISPLLDTINIQMVGGGGGGRKAGTSDNSSPNAGPGGSSIVKVVQSNGSVRSTHTAGGGAAATHGVGSSFSAGQNGTNFAHPGGGAHSSFAGTGGAGGAYNTGNPGASGGTGAGGGGQGQAGGGSAAEGGGGGGAGTFYTTTLSKASGHFVSTDSIQIIVGAPGTADHYQSGNTPNVRAGGYGGAGRVRLKGEDT